MHLEKWIPTRDSHHRPTLHLYGNFLRMSNVVDQHDVDVDGGVDDGTCWVGILSKHYNRIHSIM